MKYALTELVGMIYLVLTVVPISDIKEMKFMDIGRLGKFYVLALGNNVIITCTPRRRQVILEIPIQSLRAPERSRRLTVTPLKNQGPVGRYSAAYVEPTLLKLPVVPSMDAAWLSK